MKDHTRHTQGMRPRDSRLIRLTASLVLLGAISMAHAHPARGAQLVGPTPYLQGSDGPFNSVPFDWHYLDDFEEGLFKLPGVTKSV